MSSLEALEHAAASGKADASAWLQLAEARGKAGDGAGKLAAIDAALKLEPRALRTLVAKADHLAEIGDGRAASAFYSAALRSVAPNTQVPAEAQALLRRAQDQVARYAREFEDFIRARIDAAGGAGASARFDQGVDILLGKKRVYLQEPRYFYFPGLPQIQFYERARFPFLDGVEAATEAVRGELEAVLARTSSFSPYVTQDPNRPPNRQHGMAGNPDWSAYFLIKEGARAEGADACPQTLAALADAPLCEIPGRAPGVLFSLLKPGARIPPHTGMLNCRLICHLPVIVPPDCEFRVGNDVRVWQAGKAWVFDDTMEHEAWNRSSANRYVLIFDIWRPELAAEERALICTLMAAVDAYGGAAKWENA